MHTQILRTTALGILLTAILAQAALAGGELKNEWPFTRPVASRTAQAATHATQVSSPVIQGEPKNEAPFTRPIAQPATIVVESSRGFSWIDGAIGLVSGLGLAIVGVGATSLMRSAHRGMPRTAL
jgi:hypothetical protein